MKVLKTAAQKPGNGIQAYKRPQELLCCPHIHLIQVMVSPASAQTCPAMKSPSHHCPTRALEPRLSTRKVLITAESLLLYSRSTSWPATPQSGTSRMFMNSSALCQVAMRSLKSFALRRLMARPWCSSKRIISWAQWTSNWALHWRSSPASVCSRTRSLTHNLISSERTPSQLCTGFFVPLWLWVLGIAAPQNHKLVYSSHHRRTVSSQKHDGVITNLWCMPSLGRGDNPSCQEDKHNSLTICASKCSSLIAWKEVYSFFSVLNWTLWFVCQSDTVVVLVLIVTAK